MTLARRALRAFGIEASCVRKAWHSTNEKFRVTAVDARVYALRVGRPFWPKEAWARSIVAFTEDLLTAGFAVPRPVHTTHGEGVAVLDGERACTLETWLPGRRHVTVRSAWTAEALGALLARIHAHSFTPCAGFELREAGAALRNPDDAATVAVRRVLSRSDRAVFDAKRCRVLETLDAIRGTSEWGVTVGDFGPHNVVWDRRTPQLVDFGDLGWGAYAYDLAYVHGLVAPSLRPALLEGYASARRVPAGWQDLRAARYIKSMRARVAGPAGATRVRALMHELRALT